MAGSKLIVLSLFFSAASCSSKSEEQTNPDSGLQSSVDASTAIDASPQSDATGCAITTVYLNRSGSVVRAGDDDSVANTSRVLSGDLAPASLDAQAMTDLLQCTSALTAEYAIEVTDVDPGSVDHLEIVLTSDLPTEFGFPSGVTNVFEQNCDEVTLRGLSFVFVESTQGNGLGVCDVVGFILGGSAGLSRDLPCESAMSAESKCANKAFLDQETDCANLICGTCGGGAATQNAHDKMLAGFGASCN